MSNFIRFALTLAALGVCVFAGSSARADESPALFFVVPAVSAPVIQPLRTHIRRHRYFGPSRLARGDMLRGLTPALAAKAREITSACGARVVSGVRHTRIAGSHRLSLHASGRAVDLAGAPACIYAHLRGWPGGVSTDYGRVRHVHVSLGGREDGLRFAHYQPRRVRVAWR